MDPALERWLQNPAKRRADALRQPAAEALMRSGERIQASFFAHTVPPWLSSALNLGVLALNAIAIRTTPWAALIAVATIGATTYVGWRRDRVVIVTSERILICGPASRRDPLGPVLREVERDVTLSPPPGTWGKFEQLGEQYWVSKRHRQDLADSDAARAASRGSRADA